MFLFCLIYPQIFKETIGNKNSVDSRRPYILKSDVFGTFKTDKTTTVFINIFILLIYLELLLRGVEFNYFSVPVEFLVYFLIFYTTFQLKCYLI